MAENNKKESVNIIAIVGLMGVGKSTLGLKLAKKMGYYFIDSDQEIEDREKRSITEIFSKSGEKYFRNVEENVIREVILRDEKAVLSLGGGAFMNENTRKLLKDKSLIIWLHADIEHILRRTSRKGNRPLLNNVNKRKVLEDLLRKRNPIYSEADLDFDTGEENQEQLVNKIIKEISNYE